MRNENMWNKPNKNISDKIAEYKQELIRCARLYEQEKVQYKRNQRLAPWTQEERNIIKQINSA